MIDGLTMPSRVGITSDLSVGKLDDSWEVVRGEDCVEIEFESSQDSLMAILV